MVFLKIFTSKLLFAEWLLAINIAIGRKITKFIARIDIDNFYKSNYYIDMRKIPQTIKNHMIYDQAELKKRWDLCKGCEFLTESDRCTKCGCFMAVKHKISLAKCPIGKWDQYKGSINGS